MTSSGFTRPQEIDHLHMSDEDAGKLATRILTYLGCSFEILWPNDPGYVIPRSRLQEKAEDYAARQPTREWEREEIVEAYKAGWSAAPKSVRYRGPR